MRPAPAVAVALLCAFALAVSAGSASAAVTPVLAGTTLTLTGDGADDTVALNVVGGTDLTVDLNADGVADATFPLTSLTAVTVNAGAGSDQVSASAAVMVPITMNGGDGADTLTGGAAGDTISGGDGPDTLAGGRGNDLISGDAGADSFAWNPGDGSDTQEGGTGSDLSVFTSANVNEVITLGPDGTHARLTRDVANIVQEMGDIESLDVRMLGGTNTFTSAAGVAAVLPFVRVLGGGVVDTFTGGDEVDELIGGPGADVINAGGGDDVIPLGLFDGGDTIDAGPGTDTLAVTGSDASETYSIGVPAVAAASVSESGSGALLSSLNTERVRIEALGGNDTVTLQGPAATALTVDLRGGAGDDTLSGGAGSDILRGGDGEDRLDGAGGNDQLFGDAGDDLLLGRAGADVFACGGVGDTLDATAEDTVGADCLPPVPPVVAPAAPSQPAAAAVADTKAPSLTLRGLPAKITRAVLLKRGLRFTVTASEASALAADLLVRARSAVISAVSPNLSVARQTLRRAAGTRKLTLKPSSKLLGRAKRFTLTVRIVATDAAGNSRTVSRTVKVTG